MKIEDVLKTTNFKDEVHKATLNVLYTSYWLKDHTSSALKENGLTTEQFNVLRILRGKHPESMCVRDIASRMIERSSNVPRIIDRLVVKKLVKRVQSKEDKRETLINITEAGLKQLEQASKSLESINRTILGLTNQEAETLNMLLEKLRKID
ncbi:MAG TPA: MarR family transcriptional regulator [Flavipsychrobacter sp.]